MAVTKKKDSGGYGRTILGTYGKMKAKRNVKTKRKGKRRIQGQGEINGIKGESLKLNTTRRDGSKI